MKKFMKRTLASLSSMLIFAFVILLSSAVAEALEIGSGYINAGSPKNVFSMPDPNSEVITTLAVGEPCNILTVGGDWVEIEYFKEMTGRGTGYVTKSGIEKAWPGYPDFPQTPNQTTAPSSPQSPASPAYGTAIVNNQNGQLLNLRASSSTASESLGLYYTGVEVMCHSDPTLEWVKVTIGNRTGYMKSEFLYHGNDSSSVVPHMPSAAVTNNSANGWLNLRSGPSLDAEVYGRFYNGDTVTILGVLDGWCHVKAGDLYGFMAAGYLNVIHTTPSNMPVGSRNYATVQYIMRGYTINAAVTETANNVFAVSVETVIDPNVKLNSYPSSYNLYINRALVASLSTIDDVSQSPFPLNFVGEVSFSHGISVIQIVPVDSQGMEWTDEGVFLR